MGWGGVLFIVAALFSTVIVEPVVVVRVVGAVDGDIAHLHTLWPGLRALTVYGGLY